MIKEETNEAIELFKEQIAMVKKQKGNSSTEAISFYIVYGLGQLELKIHIKMYLQSDPNIYIFVTKF